MALTTEENIEPNPKDFSKLIGSRYTIVKESATGGEATLFKAVDAKHNREVAIKAMRASTNNSAIDRWSRCTLPSVVPLLDLIVENGTTFFVMPWIDGRSLTEAQKEAHQLSINDRKKRLKQLLRIVVAIARDIGSINRSGIIHNDLKSGNVIVAKDERHFWICDWTSNASVPVTEEAQNENRKTLGTIQARSDETRENKKGIQLSDINALSRMTYALVTDTSLPEGDLEAINELSKKAVSIPLGDADDLGQLLKAGLNKTIVSANEFADFLEQWAKNQPLPWTSPGRLITWNSRRHLAALIGMSAVAILAFLLFVSYQWNSVLSREIQSSTQDLTIANQRLEAANAAENEQKKLATIRGKARDELISSFGNDVLDIFNQDDLEAIEKPTLESYFDGIVSYCRKKDSVLSKNTQAVLLAAAAKYFYLTENKKARSRALFKESLALVELDFPQTMLWEIRNMAIKASYGEDEGVLQEALPLAYCNLEEMAANDHGKTELAATTLVVMGDVLKELSRIDEAIEKYKKALEIRQTVLSENDYITGNLMIRIGRCHELKQEIGEARDWMERGLAVLTASGIPKSSTYMIAAEADLVRLRIVTKADPEETSSVIEELIPRARQAFGDLDAVSLTLENFQLISLFQAEDFEKASSIGQQIVRKLPTGAQQIPKSKEAAIISTYLIVCCLAGEETEAVVTFTRLKALCDGFPDGHPGRAVLTLHGGLLHVLAADPTSIEHTRTAIEELRANESWTSASVHERSLVLAEYSLQSGDNESASAFVDKSFDVLPQPQWVEAWALSIKVRLNMASPEQVRRHQFLFANAALPEGLKKFLVHHEQKISTGGSE